MAGVWPFRSECYGIRGVGYVSYVWNWSVLGNMALPFGTVGAALGRKGAC
ncbi:hypothetical protein MCC01970_12100 [Bifidobacteriaceae bacterium MCC01970]|nr:hypothetical protein HMPREF1494_1375 [Bifidobacterium sp. MSTE12]GDZ40487.1 hypothetical protein MCC01970_12100 [Bifidobacteriaceae bacterium MCC01970]